MQAFHHLTDMLGANRRRRLSPRHLSPKADSPSATNESDEMRLSDDDESAENMGIDAAATVIFSFLPYGDIIRLRQVCTTWQDAAKKTIVPLTEFEVNGVGSHNAINIVRKYNAMKVMSTAVPNLQQLSICGLGHGHKYIDGEDPDEERAAWTANWTSHDIDIISRFSRLRSLNIWGAPLNGRYPVLFNFPLLQKLSIFQCSDLKWDLEMLEGLPSLKELECAYNQHLSGCLSSLRGLNDTLEKVEIFECRNIRGNFMDLADFPHLRMLDLSYTNVTGDIRDIGENHFPALESLFLPKSVYGGRCYDFRNISDVPSVIHAVHLLLQRSPTMFDRYDSLSRGFDWMLKADSPDWYVRDSDIFPPPPFRLQIVQAGSGRGWSWCTFRSHHSCEINWLDPEPSIDESDYEAYIEDLKHIERRIDFYRGYHQPPTQEEYRRLCELLA